MKAVVLSNTSRAAAAAAAEHESRLQEARGHNRLHRQESASGAQIDRAQYASPSRLSLPSLFFASACNRRQLAIFDGIGLGCAKKRWPEPSAEGWRAFGFEQVTQNSDGNAPAEPEWGGGVRKYLNAMC